MVEKIRRVVTGHDKNGKSIFIEDGDASAVKEMESMPGLALTDLWVTNSAPADNSGNADAADRPVVLEPPSNGTIFRIVEFPSDSAWRDNADAKEAFASIGADHATDDSTDDAMMHKTSTVDYLLVLKGEIWAILDDGAETCLKQGDVMVQRGTNHSWSVRTDEPCLLAAILVDSKPV
ncbi:MAG: cupin domain-containing protein [Rhodospirillales bacterium]